MKRTFVITLLLAFFCMAYASILQDEVPVVMTEKVVNPYGATSMLSKQYLFDYTMREHIHNHPHNIPFPSGFGEYYGTGDMEFARQLQGIRPSVQLFIYLPGTKKYVGYNKDSTIDDF